MSQQRIRVAITGGGIAGATLLHALLPHPNLDVHIFESASEFKEAGMAIGIARNAFQALELIGPSARNALEKAGSIPHHGVKFMLANGPDAGKLVDEIDARKDGKRLTSIVHRAAFLKELLDGVPAERMHANKKLASVEKEDGSVILHFADGKTHACDVLVGADGIHSTVRKMILGAEDKAATPVSAGWFHLMSLQPYSKMQEILGDKFVDLEDAREFGWFGDGTFMMHNVLSGGEFVQYIATVRDDSPDDGSWKKTVSAAEMKQFFHDYPPHLQKALAAVIGDNEKSDYMCTFEHLPARTYVDGPVCIMGDAAHATTPWQGSGGGISIEDALVLSSLLASIESSKEVPMALQVYDEVRRPRTQRVVESSKGTGLIFTGRNAEYSMDLAGLSGKLPPRWDFILDFDNGKARDEAIRLLKSRLE